MYVCNTNAQLVTVNTVASHRFLARASYSFLTQPPPALAPPEVGFSFLFAFMSM